MDAAVVDSSVVLAPTVTWTVDFSVVVTVTSGTQVPSPDALGELEPAGTAPVELLDAVQKLSYHDQ